MRILDLSNLIRLLLKIYDQIFDKYLAGESRDCYNECGIKEPESIYITIKKIIFVGKLSINGVDYLSGTFSLV